MIISQFNIPGREREQCTKAQNAVNRVKPSKSLTSMPRCQQLMINRKRDNDFVSIDKPCRNQIILEYHRVSYPIKS